RSGVAYEGPSIPTNPSPKKVVEQETEETTDKEKTNFQGSTAHIPPPVNPIPIPEPDVLKTLPKPNILYPSQRNDQKFCEKYSYQKEKIFQMFQDLRFYISFANALFLMPRFAPTIRNLLMNKEKLLELAKIPLNENCSVMFLKKLPEKLGDPGKFLIPCNFLGMDVRILKKWTKEIPKHSKNLKRTMHSMQGMMFLLIKEMDDFKEYGTVFIKVDAPMNQPQPVVSTQGTHRITPSAHRSPTVSASPPVTKKRNQIAVEKDDDDSGDRIEPGSHKDNQEVVDDDDDKEREQKDDEMGSLEIRNEETHTTIPTPLSSPRKMRQGYMIQDMERKCVTTAKFWETHNKIDDIFHEVVPQIVENVTNDLIEANLKPCIVNIITEDHDAFRQKKDNFHSHHDKHQDDDAPLEGEKRVKRSKKSKRSKSARGSSPKHSRKDSTTYVSKQQNKHQEWDAWEEENVIDEDEVIPEDVTPELIAESQNVDKRVPTIFDHARMEATLRDSLSNMSRNTEEYAYHLEQSTSIIENQIVWKSIQQDIPRTIPKTLIFYRAQRNPNEPPRPLYNKDLFFLKYGNTEEKKYILSLYKIHAKDHPEPDLEEKLNR
ncbi:hypothetical protein Tco_0018802, partial [Tanacetum coccineum]